MEPAIATPLTRQRETDRQQAVAAPPLRDEGPLAASHVTHVMPQAGVAGRNRLLPPHRTRWTFLLQVRSPDGSCREALSRLRPWMSAHGQTPGAPPTGRDWRARKRRPAGVVATLARHRGPRWWAHTPEAWRWKGRGVNIVEGSTGARPATAANHAASPQPRRRQPG